MKLTSVGFIFIVETVRIFVLSKSEFVGGYVYGYLDFIILQIVLMN